MAGSEGILLPSINESAGGSASAEPNPTADQWEEKTPNRCFRFLHLLVGKNSGTTSHFLHIIQRIVGRSRRQHDELPLELSIAGTNILNDTRGQALKRDVIENQITEGSEDCGYGILMCSPPCNTFSRVRHKRNGGLVPLSSILQP